MVGSTVLDRFHVERKLGKGGFGTVYQAWDGRLERDVAVKVIDAEGEAGKRVLTEAQAAARLNHPGIVTLYELGEADGQALLVSELIEGETLHRLTADGMLTDREIAEAGADLCEALDHAHSRGVIHRDVKPHNIIVTDRDPHAKLMDFGIARVLDSAGHTATGTVVGTLAYMAPEQASGERTGAETDVYSLALTLYECWAGRNPQLRDTPAATARAIGGRVTSLGRRRRDLPPELVNTVDACLDPDPRRRPSLEELGTVLEGSLDELDAETALPPRGRMSWPVLDFSPSTAGRMTSAAVLAGLVIAALVTVQSTGPAWGWLLVPLAAGLTVLNRRLGFVATALALSFWLAAADRPGSALVLAVVTVPPALILRNATFVALPAAAPALGLIGAAPLFPALVAFVGGLRTRMVLAATGFVWLAVAEVVMRKSLFLGSPIHPPKAWQQSAGAAITDVLVPLLLAPGFIGGLLLWMAAAAIAGVLLAPVRAWWARRAPADSERFTLQEVPAAPVTPPKGIPAQPRRGRAHAAGRGRSAMVS